MQYHLLVMVLAEILTWCQNAESTAVLLSSCSHSILIIHRKALVSSQVIPIIMDTLCF